MIPLYSKAFCAVTHIIGTISIISLFFKGFWAFSCEARLPPDVSACYVRYRT
jgi:hypothetical protein